MLQSADATAPPTNWADQPVNGRPGKFDVQGDTQILTFKVAGGQWVVVQAPVSLGWDSAELAKFGWRGAGTRGRAAGTRLSLRSPRWRRPPCGVSTARRQPSARPGRL